MQAGSSEHKSWFLCRVKAVSDAENGKKGDSVLKWAQSASAPVAAEE